MYKAALSQAQTLYAVAEVGEFCRFLEPTAEEAAMREAATQRVREVILSIWPQASVQVFGSFVTGKHSKPALLLVTPDKACIGQHVKLTGEEVL